MTPKESVKHKDAGKLVISKEIATGSDKDTAQVFTFTVKLKNADGTPYVMFVQAASEGEELHIVAPSQDGVITLTTTGTGKAVIENLQLGAIYEIVEESVEGWTLVGKSGEKGTIEENAASEAIFTNAEEGKKTIEVKSQSTLTDDEVKAESSSTTTEKKAETKKKSQNKATSTRGASATSGLAKTGDGLPIWPLMAITIASLATLVVVRRKHNER